MSKQGEFPPVFDNKRFWLKIGIDYVDAKRDAKESDQGLPAELLSRFLKGRRKVIKERYDTIDQFLRETRESPQAKDILYSIYAESLWTRNWSEGVEFEHISENIQEVTKSLNNDLDYEDVNDTYGIIWTTETKIRQEKQEGDIVGTRPNETDPIVVKKSESGLKIRGSSDTRDSVVEEFEDREDIEEVEPEVSSEEVTAKVDEFLSTDYGDFKIIGVKFNSSELPEGSKIHLMNERPVYDDLQKLDDKHVISTLGVSSIEKVYLLDNKTGGKFRVKLNHRTTGFLFELESPDKLEKERDQFKDRFVAKTGIQFETVYEYGSQDQSRLFDSILSGDGEAYEKYYSELNDEYQDYFDRMVDAVNKELKTCLSTDCGTRVRADEPKCSECGGTTFSDTYEITEVGINEDQVATLVKNSLEELNPDPEQFEIGNWRVEERQMNKRSVIYAKFHKNDYTDRGSSTTIEDEIVFAPQGNRRRPPTVDNYLLKCVYVTYGDSAVADYEGYGRIPLFDLLFGGNPEAIVGRALQDAMTQINGRILRKSTEAHQRADEYLDILKDDDSLVAHKDQLNEYYDTSGRGAQIFEKDIFYLLKELFKQTERWGEIGAKQTDGLVAIPQPNSRDDYVAKYDAKLSHRQDGYDFGTKEEDQATRYMLNSEEEQRLRAKSGRKTPSAHILVSQNFNPNDFQTRAKGVQQNLEDRGTEERPDLVFMEYSALVSLYELAEDYQIALDNSTIKEAFVEDVLTQLQSVEGPADAAYVHFDQDCVEAIKNGLLSLVDKYDIEPIRHHSEN